MAEQNSEQQEPKEEEPKSDSPKKEEAKQAENESNPEKVNNNDDNKDEDDKPNVDFTGTWVLKSSSKSIDEYHKSEGWSYMMRKFAPMIAIKICE